MVPDIGGYQPDTGGIFNLGRRICSVVGCWDGVPRLAQVFWSVDSAHFGVPIARQLSCPLRATRL